MKKTIILLSAALLAAAAASAQGLTILHVNDTHSHIDPIRGGIEDGLGGVIEFAAYVDSVRTADGKKNVLLLHAGDFGQGTSYFPMMNGDIEIELMNELKFDVSALGNHEFDNGTADLERRLKDAKFDAVCANYDFTGDGKLGKYVKPYRIVRKAGKKIGIIGLLADVRTLVDKDIAETLIFLDPIETTNKYAAELKEKGCDIVIVLSHVGTVEKLSDQDVAAWSKDVDYIIGGHSHTFISEPILVKNQQERDVPVVTVGCWGLFAGNLKIK